MATANPAQSRSPNDAVEARVHALEAELGELRRRIAAAQVGDGQPAPEPAALRAVAERVVALEKSVASTAALVDSILRQLVERVLQLEKQASPPADRGRLKATRAERSAAPDWRSRPSSPTAGASGSCPAPASVATAPPPVSAPRPAMRSLPEAESAGESWRSRLYTPTYFAKLGGDYFLVDCWHHRVLCSDTPALDLSAWETLDESLAGPHSIDSDGVNYVVDDTGMDRLRIYQKHANRFRLVNTVDNVGTRPHRVRYDVGSGRFYVIAQDLFAFTFAPNGGVGEILRYPLAFLGGAYTRSFTLHDGFLYLVSGNGFIHKTVVRNDAIVVAESYPVPLQARSMNDLWFAPGRVLITASPQVILEAESLPALARGEFVDRFAGFGFKGTPYYISEFDGAIYIPEIIEHSGVLQFDQNLGLGLPSRRFDFGPPTPDSLARYKAFPK